MDVVARDTADACGAGLSGRRSACPVCVTRITIDCCSRRPRRPIPRARVRLSGRAWGMDFGMLNAGKARQPATGLFPFLAATYRYVP